jgi:hypothetical protein
MEKLQNDTFKERPVDLLHEITRCPNIRQCFTSQDSNPCSKIIFVQHSPMLDQHQVPEPWNGDLQHAPLLFLSSNPALDENEVFPLWSCRDESIEHFFTHRLEHGAHTVLQDGSKKRVPFWSNVHKRAQELLDGEVSGGVDYALTEVVHCKSRTEKDINKETVNECVKRYLQRVVELSGAKVIVVMGSKARKAVKDEFRLSDGSMFGPLHIGQRERYIVFLPHPNAYAPRTFEKCLEKQKLQELRAFLNP